MTFFLSGESKRSCKGQHGSSKHGECAFNWSTAAGRERLYIRGGWGHGFWTTHSLLQYMSGLSHQTIALHPRPSFLPLCHKEVLNEHSLWSFRLRFLKRTNIGCFVQLNTFRQHPFLYSREILLFTRTGQTFFPPLCFCCWRYSSYCMLACIQKCCHSGSGCYGQNMIQICSDIIQQLTKSNEEGNWAMF